MSTIPSNLARVPVRLSAQMLLSAINRGNSDLLYTQVQLSSGLKFFRPSEDAIGGSLATTLDRMLEQRGQRLRNLDHAEALINTSDGAIAEASQIALDGKSIAASMIGPTVDEETRANQAQVIDTMLQQLLRLSNQQFGDVYLFGGAQSGRAPVEAYLGGYRFTGTRDGMQTDLSSGEPTEVTLTAHDVFGSMSARVEGDHDLDPALTGTTRLDEINGARGEGVTLGVIEIDIAGVDSVQVDLTGADSVQDVIDRIDDAIAQVETDNSVSVLEGARVSLNAAGNGLALDVAAGMTVTISEVGSGVTAADLGLTQGGAFVDGTADGADLDARVTQFTALTDIAGMGAPADFSITNGGVTRNIAASGAATVQDLQNLVKQAGIGARLEISADGSRLNLINELSGGVMSVAESTGGTTAGDLGIRTFTTTTRLSDLNDGRGVEMVIDGIDPETGLPDPTRETDFRVTLSDGSTFDVDLTDEQTLGDVITSIQTASGGLVTVSIADDNGLVLTDLSGGAGDFYVEPLNGSSAAEDLGIQKRSNSATLTGDDVGGVAVHGLFASLLALRDALLDNDERGITFAGETLEADIDRLAQARAILGQRGNRVTAMKDHEESQRLTEESMKSQIQSLDYAEASVRFSTLQTQIQAAMLSGARLGELSLIRFLG